MTSRCRFDYGGPVGRARVMRRCPRDGIRATMHDNDVTIDARR